MYRCSLRLPIEHKQNYIIIVLSGQVNSIIYYNARTILLNYKRVIYMVDYKVIGNRLKAYRQQAGLTQEKIAEQAGITVVYLSKIENGHVHPTIDLLQTLCDAINCDLGNLFQNVSPASSSYENERVLDLFNACAPEVKPIALNLLEQLSKLP